MRKNRVWTLKTMKEVALKYKTKKEFALGDCGAYKSAKRKGWFEEVTKHMKTPKVVRVSIQEVKDRLKKYDTLKDLLEKEPSLYKLALKKLGRAGVGHLRKYRTLSDRDLIKIAESYTSSGDLIRKDPSAYVLIKRRKIKGVKNVQN